MNKSKIVQALSQVISDNGIDELLDKQADAIAKFLLSTIEQMVVLKEQPNVSLFDTPHEANPKRHENNDENDSVNKFVDEMYSLYPTRCPKRNTTLGKSRKDKVKIKRLLKTYSREEIERVIRHEVDSNYGINYMKNFSTFLNNFPDPNEVSEKSETSTMNTSDKVFFNGVEYK